MQAIKIIKIGACEKGNAEWVEIQNKGTKLVDLTNWKFWEDGVNHKIKAINESFFLDPNQKARIIDNEKEFRSVYPDFQEILFDSSWGSLKNTGETIGLVDSEGILQEEVTYEGCVEFSGSGRSLEIKKEAVLMSGSGFSLEKVLITEIAPYREGEMDFIEIGMKGAEEEIQNLKSLIIKYKGKIIKEFKEDLLIEPGQFKAIDIEEGLSKGSGSIELLERSERGAVKSLDFVCWKNKKLSQEITKIVEQKRSEGVWNGDCVEINSIIKKESIARNKKQIDTNGLQDFFRHYNGSKGYINETINHKPKAIITIQGSKRMSGTTPFYLNVTGTESIDRDGEKDLVAFVWKKNGVIFSTKENPKGIRIIEAGVHEIELIITDKIGATGKIKIPIEVLKKSVNGGSRLKWEKKVQKKLVQKRKMKKRPRGEVRVREDFFAPIFKNQVFMEQLKQLSLKKNKEKSVLEKKVVWGYKRDFFRDIKPQRIKKNLGIIFADF